MQALLLGAHLLLFTQNACAQSREDALFKAKAALLLPDIAYRYSPPSKNIGDPEKYYWPKAMARMLLKPSGDDSAKVWIRELSRNPPFHFTLVGMARLMFAFPKEPAVIECRKNYLKLVLSRVDNYNAWTCEGTENHVSMSRTSGYLFAEAAMQYPDLKPEATKRQAQMKEWILDWSKRAFRMGTGEWNSGIYEVYNLLGWLNLADYAQDDEVKKAARAMVDYYALELAIHYDHGRLAGAEMRGNPVGPPEGNAAHYIMWLWFAPSAKIDLRNASEHIQSIHAVLSGYRPPTAILAIARKNDGHRGLFTGLKPSYTIEQPAKLGQTLYADSGFTLGSVTTSYSGYTGASAQIVPWKAIIETNGEPFLLSGNGRYAAYGEAGRDPYTQIIQHKNVLLQLTKVPGNASQIEHTVDSTMRDWQVIWRQDFLKRFPDKQSAHHKNKITRRQPSSLENRSYLSLPANTTLQWTDNQAIAQVGNNTLILTCIGTRLPNKAMSVRGKQAKARRLILEATNAPDVLCGWIVEIVDRRKAAETKSKLEGLVYTDVHQNAIPLRFADSGLCSEPLVDWGYGQTEPSVYVKAPPMRVPSWPTTKGYGRMSNLESFGPEMNYVYKGPGVLLADGILQITGSSSYRVDYSKRIPVFEELSQ